MTYLVRRERNGRWKTLSTREEMVVKWKTRLQSLEELPAVTSVQITSVPSLNADSQHLSSLFTLLHFAAYNNRLLNINVCLSKQN